MKCEEFVHAMVAGRVMGLDVGKVRVGVALSDPLGFTAQPLLTLWRKSRGENLQQSAAPDSQA